MRKSVHILCIIVIAIIYSGSVKSQDTLHYIFLGHIKKPIGGLYAVDDRVAGLDYDYFDRIWLGGDITGESSLDFETLEYIDGLFDVSNPSNHWAFGNHDLRNFNLEWIEEITNRKTYYAYFENGITTVVLNLAIAPDDCERLNEQYQIIQKVCDTIEDSKYLIFLMHHGIWQDVPGLPGIGTYSHSNQKAWIANCFDQNASFYELVYPLQLSVKNRGIVVINILGDSGSYNKGISMTSDDGIFFIASGIDPLTQETRGPDKVLIFDHVLNSNSLNWQFHNLDSLFESFQ